ncbi:TPA: YecA family protein [Klebsiella quasipneumoniae subsp. quasipneumoniae]
MNNEQAKFLELEELCKQDGFIHAYSYLCLRDCTIGFQGGLETDDLNHLTSSDRLIKTELSLLHGLMLKSGYNAVEISSDKLTQYVDSAEQILKDIHEAIKTSGMKNFSLENPKLSFESFFTEKDVVREFIFYSAEQAFEFQFASFARERYIEDEVWLRDHVGFDMNDAYTIYRAINEMLNENLNSIASRSELISHKESRLQFHEINVDELIRLSKQSKEIVIAFLTIFSTSSKDDNTSFSSIDDFNIINAKPIVYLNDKYYLFQLTSLAQSMYESPIFWMREDKSYRKFADEHRGNFTEAFTYNKLVSVFGRENVYVNIDIFKNAAEKIGEIDILVKFGSKYLIVQAKSKGMTLSSRKGQAEIVKDDFTKGFQNAYDQAIECSNALMEAGVHFKDASGNLVEFKNRPTSCYPVCITSESYPSLAFQCRLHLKYEKTEHLKAPYIMDIFFLDILTEFLSEPLFFLSFVDRRTGYHDALMASTEIVLLSMHLKYNLWIENDMTFMHLADDIASDLDAAFMVRRLALPGSGTPKGILQKYTSGFFGRLLFKIQRLANDDLTDLGLILLKGNGKFVDMLNEAVGRIQYLTIQDNLTHDFTIQLENGVGGLTVHTLAGDLESAQNKLMAHVNAKKYLAKQNQWFGVLVEADRLGMVASICKLSFPWQKDTKMDLAVKEAKMDKPMIYDSKELRGKFKVKLGRNDKCLCGSGKKYKKCCLIKNNL